MAGCPNRQAKDTHRPAERVASKLRRRSDVGERVMLAQWKIVCASVIVGRTIYLPEGDERIPFCRIGNRIADVVAAIMQILEARSLLHSFFFIVSLMPVRVWIPELDEKSLKQLGMLAACFACLCVSGR